MYRKFFQQLQNNLEIRKLLNNAIKVNFESLNPTLDCEFHTFYKIFEEQKDISVIDKYLPGLIEAGFMHFATDADFETTKKFLQNLRVIWVMLFKIGKIQEAKWYLKRVLQIIHQFEERTSIQIHKGPMYYFEGGTALILGQIDEGFLFMHKAYTEEIRIHEPQPTPSFNFVSLNFINNNQYFHVLVTDYIDYLQKKMIPYRFEKGTSIQIDEFQKYFLASNPQPDIVFSFTHALAKLHQFSSISRLALNSDFASQFELNLLFDLVLVIENALRIKHPASNSGKAILFPESATHLATSLQWNISQGHFTNTIRTEANKNYDKCMLDLLDRKFNFKHKIKNLKLESDLCIAYLIRNRGAHDLLSSNAISSRFQDIQQSLFNILFLTVEELYI